MAKLTREGAQTVYQAAERFVDAGLRHEDSLFTPGRTVWVLPTAQDFHARLVQHEDAGTDSFLEKFQRQLAEAPAETIQFAGELLYVHVLVSTHMKGPAKRRLISSTLSWSPVPASIPRELDGALDSGLVHTGQAYQQYRFRMLAWLTDFVIRWKALSDADREARLGDPWMFKALVEELPSQTAQAQRQALLHLTHPNTFEPIISVRHKELICQCFANLVDEPSTDVDRQILQIRKKLAAQHGPTFNFYQQGIVEQWRPRKPDGEHRVWVEKTHVQGRQDRLEGPDAMGKALWSPQKTKKRGRDYYRKMREVQAGDLVLHLVDDQRFVGVSRVADRADDGFVGLPGTPWEGQPALRVPLVDYAAIEPPLGRQEVLQDDRLRPRLDEILHGHGGLFFNRKYELDQGAYLTEAPPALVALLNQIHQEKTGSGLPYLSKPGPLPPLTMKWLTETTLWPEADLQDIIDTIQQGTRQVVLAGPPGTGKTWIAQALARFLTQDRSGAIRTVQLHPTYSYEQFIEGLRPVAEHGAIHFKPVDGVVVDFAKRAMSQKGSYVLVIDEMNRANLPKVFGELMYLFEYRDHAIDLQYSKGFVLPTNLVFIGTMNTADRSIRSIDIALRRRFDVFECRPDAGLLERYYETHTNEVANLRGGFEKLNAQLHEALDRHHLIGHTFFMVDPMTPNRLKKIWKHKIEPLIEEYFFDQSDVATEFRFDRYWTGL